MNEIQVRKINDKGQITLPYQMRKKASMNIGEDVVIIYDEKEKKIVIKPKESLKNLEEQILS